MSIYNYFKSIFGYTDRPKDNSYYYESEVNIAKIRQENVDYAREQAALKYGIKPKKN